MAKRLLPSDEYWKKRSVRRTLRSEKGMLKHAQDIDNIYTRAQQTIQADIDQIYKTYLRGNKTLDLDALLKSVPPAETQAFWETMKKAGHMDYIGDNYKARLTRLELMQGQIYKTVADIATPETNAHTASHMETINNTAGQTAFDLSKGVNENIGFGGLDTRTVDTMLNTKWQKGSYSTRIWGNTDVLGKKLSQELGASILTGRAPTQLSRDLQEQFGVSRFVANRLIRTEHSYYHNETEAIVHKSMGVEEYTFISTLDNRTSEICQNQDHKRHKLKDKNTGVNYPPMHPNCRSTTRPYVGKDYEPTTRVARDEDGKSVQIADMSYPQWKALNGVKTVTPSKPPVPTKSTTPPKAKAKTSAPVYAGVTKGKPMSPSVAVVGTNPNRVKGGVWTTNCQKTVPTYEMRRRGYDVTALPRDANSYKVDNGRVIPTIWGQTEFDYRSGVAKITRPDGTSYNIRKRTVKSEVVENLRSYPVGARLQMTYAYVGRRVGHTTVVEVVEKSKEFPHGMMFIDPQVNEIKSGLDMKGKTNFAIIRMDNRQINPDLVDIIAKRSETK